ncbi:SapC protein [Desulfobotulus alkaliphilus]|uniref:SapC protein n=1 Tax=Desulfobotulus alkaliphilus TaxID=622671 RepID=A0A562R269_9BACT|nr:SapC family protein [Desulfobotulus alkaliphilus]TWI63159.1 SapC protein [Desulfobotulus alkaliphilus]
MTQPWTDLDFSDHKDFCWKAFTHYGFAAKDRHAPLLQAELTHAMRWYPVCFVKREEGSISEYQMVVLQSLTPDLNLFVGNKGQWLASYVPSCYRGYPFRLNPSESKTHLQVHTGGDLVVTEAKPGHEPIFTSDAGFTPKVAQVLDFLNKCREDEKQTAGMLKQLAKHNLIVPWDLQTKQTPESAPEKISGYYRIDEKALKTLPGIQMSLLAQTGVLGLAYAHLYSLARLDDFRVRYQKHSSPPSAKTAVPDLDELFGDSSDGMLKF